MSPSPGKWPKCPETVLDRRGRLWKTAEDPSAGGGTRTRKGLLPEVFETSASTTSATPATSIGSVVPCPGAKEYGGYPSVPQYPAKPGVRPQISAVPEWTPSDPENVSAETPVRECRQWGHLPDRPRQEYARGSGRSRWYPGSGSRIRQASGIPATTSLGPVPGAIPPGVHHSANTTSGHAIQHSPPHIVYCRLRAYPNPFDVDGSTRYLPGVRFRRCGYRSLV